MGRLNKWIIYRVIYKMLLNCDMNKRQDESFETHQDVKHFSVLEFYFIFVLVGSDRRLSITHKGLRSSEAAHGKADQ